MDKKRTRLEIIRDILLVVKNQNGKAKPTHILYKSNLSYSMMEEYLAELLSKQFVEEKRMGKGKNYLITSKGLKFLEEYNKIVDFTNSFGLG